MRIKQVMAGEGSRMRPFLYCAAKLVIAKIHWIKCSCNYVVVVSYRGQLCYACRRSEEKTAHVRGYFGGMILYYFQPWREQLKADNPNLNVPHQSNHITFLSKIAHMVIQRSKQDSFHK